MLGTSGQELGEFIIGIILQIGVGSIVLVVGESILCHVYGSGIGEKYKMVNTILLGLLHEKLLPLGLIPIVSTIAVEVTFNTSALIGNITCYTLFGTSCTKIYAPG